MTRRVTTYFTLIELLVVVAIISILASMLLPALSNARNKARDVLCVGNIKQVYTGIALYADSHSGFIPPNQAIHPNGFVRSYHDYIADYIYGGSDNNVIAHLPALRAAWDDTSTARIFACTQATENNLKALGISSSWYEFSSQGMSSHIAFNGVDTSTASRLSDHSGGQILLADGFSRGSLNANLYPTIYGVHRRHAGFRRISYLYFDGSANQLDDYYQLGVLSWNVYPWRDNQ